MRTVLALLGIIFMGCSPEMRVYHEIDSSWPGSQYHPLQWTQTDSVPQHSNPLGYVLGVVSFCKRPLLMFKNRSFEVIKMCIFEKLIDMLS